MSNLVHALNAPPVRYPVVDRGGAFVNGRHYTGQSLNAAVADMEAHDLAATLHVPFGVELQLTGPLAVPAHIPLWVEGIIVTNGHALTIHRFVNPGHRWCFDGAGVAFTAGALDCNVALAWWGAMDSDVARTDLALTYALAAMPPRVGGDQNAAQPGDGGMIEIPVRTRYTCTRVPALGSWQGIIGHGPTSILRVTTLTMPGLTVGENVTSDPTYGVLLDNFTLEGSAVGVAEVPTNPGVLAHKLFRSRISIWTRNFGGDGWYINGASYTELMPKYIQQNRGAGLTVVGDGPGAGLGYHATANDIDGVIRENYGPGFKAIRLLYSNVYFGRTVEANGQRAVTFGLTGSAVRTPDEYHINIWLEACSGNTWWGTYTEHGAYGTGKERVHVAMTACFREVFKRGGSHNGVGLLMFASPDGNHNTENVFHGYEFPGGSHVNLLDITGAGAIINNGNDFLGCPDIRPNDPTTFLVRHRVSRFGLADGLRHGHYDQSPGNSYTPTNGLTANGSRTPTRGKLLLTQALGLQTPVGFSPGDRYSVTLVQNAVGGHALVLTGQYRHTWSDAGNGPNKRAHIEFEFDGVLWDQVSYTPWH